jgi:hypothetical protein
MRENFFVKILASAAKDLFSGNRRVSKILFVVAIAATTACCVPIATAQVPNQGGLLFSDNFTTSTPGADINADINSSTRVGGPLAGLISYDSANAVGTITLDGSHLNLASDNARIGLNKNFNGALALGGMKISYDFQGSGGTTDWGAFYSGCDSSAIPAFNTGNNWNAWITFNNYPVNNWYAFGASNGGASQYITGTTGVAFNDTMHHADIVISDMVDGAPFDGSSYKVVLYDYYIDGKFVASTWDNTDIQDMPNNFLGFLMSNPTVGASFNFTNLKVYGNTSLLDTTNQWQGVSGANWNAPSSWTASVPNGQGQNALILNAYSSLN